MQQVSEIVSVMEASARYLVQDVVLDGRKAHHDSFMVLHKRMKHIHFTHWSLLTLQSGSTRSGGAPSQLMSTIINELFKENFLKAHIEKTLIPEYARRYALFLAAIKHDLYPLGFRLDESVINRETVGGFFMWLQLPDGIDCYQLAARAAKHGVSFSIGPTTAVTRPLEVDLPFKNFIRLCFTFEEDHRLVEGVRRIALAAGWAMLTIVTMSPSMSLRRFGVFKMTLR